MEDITNNWRWGMRVTPFLGILAVLMLFFIRDPPRGGIEGAHNVQPTTYCEDVQRLSRNRSFILSTAGFTCVAFVTGALGWWAPKFIYLGLRLQPGNANITQAR